MPDKLASTVGAPQTAPHPPLPLAFPGIHIISPRLLPMLTEDGVFSIIDAYLRHYWRDLGRPADFAQAALDLQQRVLE